MTDRVPTGAARLDAILGGGLPANAISLVTGRPGSGKTIFAQQCVYTNATPDRPAVYLSTVSEPMSKILRFGQSLSFFDTSAVGSRVLYEDLGTVLGEQGLTGVLDRLRELIRRHRPGIIVIDSFKAFHPYAADTGAEFRQFLHALSGLVTAFPVTSLWVGEYEPGEIARLPESAVADAIVELGSAAEGARSSRSLQVLKLRGGSYLSGSHTYRISADGIAAFPRLADPGSDDGYHLSGRRQSSGVQLIDDMLDDGYRSGSSTLVAGPTGAGKTLMGLHFIFGGVRQGDTGVVATLQENPSQLARLTERFGWSLADEKVVLSYRSPVDLYVDEWVYHILDTVEEHGADRLLIDSLGDLEAASTDPARFREYVYSLLHRCSRRGVSVMMTYEVPQLYGIHTLSEHGASHLSDNVVLLQYRQQQDVITRAVAVLKTRASSHDARIREFTITPAGITLTDA